MLGRLLGNDGVVSSEGIQRGFGRLLADDERVYAGFKVIRDTWTFTDRCLILVDAQGMTGRKKEHQSIPYSNIMMVSVETTGAFDLDAELKLWIAAIRFRLIKKFNQSVDVYAMQGLLTQFVK